MNFTVCFVGVGAGGAFLLYACLRLQRFVQRVNRKGPSAQPSVGFASRLKIERVLKQIQPQKYYDCRFLPTEAARVHFFPQHSLKWTFTPNERTNSADRNEVFGAETAGVAVAEGAAQQMKSSFEFQRL